MAAEAAAPFGKGRGWVLGGLGVGTLVLSLIWSAVGPDEPSKVSFQPDSYSTSAVGHDAFVAVLEQLKIPVQRARFRTAMRAVNASLVVVAEPELDSADDERLLEQLVAVDTPLMLVLPKWAVSQDHRNRRHIDGATQLAETTVEKVLRTADVRGSIRTADSARCSGDFIMNVELRGVQLLVDSDLTPLVSCGEGILVGEIPRPTDELGDETGPRRVVLSDPDVIATHGLRDGGAQLAVALVTRLRRDEAPVLFDEILHGHLTVPSVYREAFSFPMLFITLSVVLLIGFVLWATMSRFGAAEPPLAHRGGDRAMLIENEVRLMNRGRDAASSLMHYRDMCFREVATRLGAPRRQTPTVKQAWLAGASEARGLGGLWQTMMRRTDAVHELMNVFDGRIRRRDVLAAADAITHWKNEMIHGA